MLFDLYLLVVICSGLPIYVTAKCRSEGQTYKPGDHWHSQQGCVLNICSDESTIQSYKKVCPPIPQCIPARIRTKDCCEYCVGDPIDSRENGDINNGYQTHSCKRECISGRSMTCKYTLNVELYESANDACFNCPFNLTDCDRKNCVPLDGVSRLVVATNRMIPGPSIHVCKDDTIMVDVHNRMLSQGLAMHWHGISQRHAPYMDGVPHIHQCPIAGGNVFRYTFDAEDSGTYFYHPHTGSEVTDGCAGLLIIRLPDSENPHRSLYDKDLYEHGIAIQDWSHLYSEDEFTRSFFVNNSGTLPDAILVNGRGRLGIPTKPPKLVSSTIDVDRAMKKLKNMPLTVFTVEKGYRYRFRLLNAASKVCPISISIDNHNLTIISTDGFDVQPFEVQQLITNDAERYDFVLIANQDMDNYWIRIKGLSFCRELETQQFAILRYKGASNSEPEQPKDYQYPDINGVRLGNAPQEEQNNLTFKVSTLRSVMPPDQGIDTSNPDYTFYLQLEYRNVNFPGFRASPDAPQSSIFQLNNVSLDLPSGVLITNQAMLDDTSIVCNDTTLKGQNCAEELCSCVYVNHVRLNSIVEVILFTDGQGDAEIEHPMHYHGYTYRVVAMEGVPGLTEEKLRKMNEQGQIKRNLVDPTPKDTVIIYNPGYTIYRFNASNPGIWLLHCHQQYHLSQGKGLFFHVGELSDLPPPPPHYPKCDNYMPM